MEKIYHETDEKSGTYNTNSPCVSVRAFRPNMEHEDGLPTIIVLEAGSINSNGYAVYGYEKYITIRWGHKGAEIIRTAIKRFDAFKKKVYKLADNGG